MKKLSTIFLMICLSFSSHCVSSVGAENRGDPFKGFGKMLGLDDKSSDILSKGMKVVKSMMPIKYREEKAIGGAVALKVFARFGGPHPSEALHQYVALVGKNVALASVRPEIPYYFAVLNSPEPNAFAAPGGYIFITIGLFKKLASEAELAGVLGHEIAHVARKHSLKTLERSKLLHGVSELTLTAMEKDPKMFANIIDDVSESLFTRGLDHKLEFEADHLGTRYAARLGYQPQGLDRFLRKLNEHQASGGGSVFFQTHPSNRTRVGRLERDLLPRYKNLENYKAVERRLIKIRKSLWTKE